MNDSIPFASPTLLRLKRSLKAAGVTQRQVARVLGVKREHVCSVLAGRYKSRRVLIVAKRLRDEARQKQIDAAREVGTEGAVLVKK